MAEETNPTASEKKKHTKPKKQLTNKLENSSSACLVGFPPPFKLLQHLFLHTLFKFLVYSSLQKRNLSGVGMHGQVEDSDLLMTFSKNADLSLYQQILEMCQLRR